MAAKKTLSFAPPQKKEKQDRRQEPLLTPAFHFRVEFHGKSGSLGNGAKPDNSFLEVSGLTAEIETESVAEGGENRFVHQLPKGVKYPKLLLKRGIIGTGSPLVKWCKQTLEGGLNERIQPMELSVRLLDRSGNPLRTWTIVNAYPVKWEVEGFNSTKNEVAVEKIELAYNYAHRTG